MKKFTKVLMILSATTLLAVSSSKAQEIVVRTRLYRSGPAVRRPFRPSPNHVWVADEWRPGGGTYVMTAGHWEVPPHPGGVWIAGHWRNRPGGYVWVPGHWR